MNKVILIGRLTAEPDVRHTESNMALCRFTLAVDRTYKKDEADTDFILCKAFRNTAEFVEKYLHKGTKIALEGRWQTGKYTTSDGVTAYTNECVVDRIEFAESKKETAPQTNVFIDDAELPF